MKFWEWLTRQFRRCPEPEPEPEPAEGSRAWMLKHAWANRKWSADALPWYVSRINRGRDRYQAVERLTGVPWQVVAVIHGLECSFKFNEHLHNGDPLAYKTVRVPKGHPRVDSWTWETSAADAMRHDKLDAVDWRDMDAALKAIEYYNGRGYEMRGMASPYLWGGTQFHSRGKYVADGRFSAEATTRQVGAGLLLKEAGFKA